MQIALLIASVLVVFSMGAARSTAQSNSDSPHKIPIKPPTPEESQRAKDATQYIGAHDSDIACGGLAATHKIIPVPDGLFMFNYAARVWLETDPKHGISAGDCAEVQKGDDGNPKIDSMINLSWADRVSVRKVVGGDNFVIDFHCSPELCSGKYSRTAFGNAPVGFIILNRDVSEQQAESLAKAFRALLRGIGAPLIDDSEF